MKQKRLCSKSIASNRKECTTAYKIDNRTVYDILDKICKDMELHLFVKKLESKKDENIR